MRGFYLVLIVSGTLSAQSLVEMGAVTAGATVGSVAGKQVSAGITSTFKKTGGILTKATKTDGDAKAPIPQAASGARVPTLQVSPGVPKSDRGGRRAGVAPEANNVPLPPPPTRPAAKTTPRPAPIPVVLREPQPEPVRVPHDTDLDAIVAGMPRNDVLTLGAPSSRITMFEDGHLVEIYSYRNDTLRSGSVRLIDGSVATVQVGR